ncbi:hypothetical protein Bca4012_084177 [Brassica carinata]
MVHPVQMLPHMKMVVVIMVTIMVRHQLLRTNLLLLEDPREVLNRRQGMILVSMFYLLIGETLKAMMKLWRMNTRICGLEPWMRRWILLKKITLLSWWNCLRARRLYLINGCSELSMRMEICHLDTRLDWL